MSIRENRESIMRDLPAHVTLVAASKKKSPEVIKEACVAGQRVFGESYVQEFLTKYDSPVLKGLDIEWHFIGNLQRNKVKYIIDKVSLIQSVSSSQLAGEIDRRAENVSKIQDILIEINIGNEESKGGTEILELEDLVEKVRKSDHLRLRGLMVIPPFAENPEELKRYFLKTKSLFDQIGNLDILSMGMSGDWREALEYGSTMVRIGTALLGPR